MRNHPYVVVLSESEEERSFIVKALGELGIPTFVPQTDVNPGENWLQRVRIELNHADAIVVSVNEMQKELREVESLLMQPRMEAGPNIIPLVSSSETQTVPTWLEGVKTLSYNPGDRANLMGSLANTLIPNSKAEDEETLEQLLAETEQIVLRLKLAADLYRHSRSLLGVSFGVFAFGFLMLTLGVWLGPSNPLAGAFQFFGLILLGIGGISFFYSVPKWSSNYQRVLLSQPLLKDGLALISASKDFLNDHQKKKRRPSQQSGDGPTEGVLTL